MKGKGRTLYLKKQRRLKRLERLPDAKSNAQVRDLLEVTSEELDQLADEIFGPGPVQRFIEGRPFHGTTRDWLMAGGLKP